MIVYTYLEMKGVVVFVLPNLIVFPFRKQLPITHCCLDCPEVPSGLHHGVHSLQVYFTLAVILAVCNTGRVTWSCVLFCWPCCLCQDSRSLLSSSFMLYLCLCTPPAACALHAFSIKLCKICCTLICLNKIFVKIY